MIIKDSIQVREDDGSFVYKGRLDNIANRGGLKISLEDLENHLQQELNVSAVAVSIPDERLGEEIAVCVKGSFPVDDIQASIHKGFNFKVPAENFFPIEAIPLNPNLKIDRSRLQTLVNLKKRLSFPVQVADILPFMPHGDSAIWIDEIADAHADFVQAKVRYNPRAHYNSLNGLRESATIEWIAQTTGYGSVAYQIVRGNFDINTKKTFLAGTSKTRFTGFPLQLSEGDELLIEVKHAYKMGPLKVVQGRVSHAGKVIAEAQLKVFAEN